MDITSKTTAVEGVFANNFVVVGELRGEPAEEYPNMSACNLRGLRDSFCCFSAGSTETNDSKLSPNFVARAVLAVLSLSCYLEQHMLHTNEKFCS